MAYRTDLPPDQGSEERADQPAWTGHRGPLPFASDNEAKSKPLLYGPKGEVLIKQEPRSIGFRERRLT